MRFAATIQFDVDAESPSAADEIVNLARSSVGNTIGVLNADSSYYLQSISGEGIGQGDLFAPIRETSTR